MWTAYRPYATLVREMLENNRAAAAAAANSTSSSGGKELLPPTEPDFDPVEDDAFSTLMQWLYWKIPDVKAAPTARRRQ